MGVTGACVPFGTYAIILCKNNKIEKIINTGELVS
jgi:hypothetical protein